MTTGPRWGGGRGSAPLCAAKVATVDSELIDKRIGKLTARDQSVVREAFCRVFAPWVRR